MDEASPGPAPENGDSLVKVKEEDPTWEQMCSSQDSSSHTLELCRLRFRRFCYQEVTGPREALAQLQELCHQWLRPETHTKEQILELLVLEQFLTILPQELQAWVQVYPLESGEDAVTVLENLEKDTGDSGQQASVYTQGQDMHLPVTEYQGTSLECQRPQLLPGVTTLKCEPPEPHQEVAQEVSGPAPQGPAPPQEENPRDQAAVPGFNSARSQTSVKTEEAAVQALVPEQWPHLSLAQRNLYGNSAQETVTNISLMPEEVVTKDGLFNTKQETSEEMERGAEVSGIPNRNSASTR